MPLPNSYGLLFEQMLADVANATPDLDVPLTPFLADMRGGRSNAPTFGGTAGQVQRLRAEQIVSHSPLVLGPDRFTAAVAVATGPTFTLPEIRRGPRQEMRALSVHSG
jgi:hypothetical protein